MGVKKLDWKENQQAYIASNPVLIHKEKRSSISFYHFLKRTIDIFTALIGIILSFPVLLIISIAIKLESPGTILFVQERVGLNGKFFNIYKLRSMRDDAEKNGPQWAEKNDPRVTKIGQFIRKTRIDELPQFYNVLIGDMSLIGPRPERPIFTEQFDKDIPGFKKRLVVKPGLTGWAQINGGYEISPKDKLKYDLYYIEHQNLVLDLKIILKTGKVIFTGEGAR